jgi:DNA-binding response OmpR family regulator
MAAGADEFITKPFSPKEVVESQGYNWGIEA